MSLASVFTPQMVVNGTRQGVGSDRSAVGLLIRDAMAHPTPHPSLTVARNAGETLAGAGHRGKGHLRFGSIAPRWRLLGRWRTGKQRALGPLRLPKLRHRKQAHVALQFMRDDFRHGGGYCLDARCGLCE